MILPTKEEIALVLIGTALIAASMVAQAKLFQEIGAREAVEKCATCHTNSCTGEEKTR